MDCPSGTFRTVNRLVKITTDIHVSQIWGFEEIDGGRLFVRRVVVKKGEQIEKVKLVYNFESD